MTGSEHMFAAMKCQHTLHHAQGHRGWDNTNAPRLSIAPGESIEFQALDASDGQLNPQSVADDLSRLDFARVNPVVGPVYIDGAAPGDVHQGHAARLHALGLGLRLATSRASACSPRSFPRRICITGTTM